MEKDFSTFNVTIYKPICFPKSVIAVHSTAFKNLKASSDTDARLSLLLKQFDVQNDKNYIFEIPLGSTFRIHNGKIFKKGNKRVKLFECSELSSGKIYLFQPNAEVELLKVN